MTTLSIIVPVYNVEKYIHKCLDSILSQSFTDFELICVNDGSPDNCGRILDEYAKNDSRIKVLHKENGGLSSARNAGLNIATGKYISYVDSDDFIAKDMYQRMLTVAIETNADIVKCGLNKFDDKSSVKESIAFSKYKIFENDASKSKLLHLYFGGVLYTIVCNAVYRRNLAQKVKFPEGLINEDNYSSGVYLFWAKRIVCLNEAFYFYRDNENGLSKTGNTKKLLDKAIVTAKLHEYLIEQGVQDNSFLLNLQKKIARRIYHCVKYSKNGNFRLCYIDKKFYSFVISRLNLSRKLKMKYYKLIKRFELN